MKALLCFAGLPSILTAVLAAFGAENAIVRENKNQGTTNWLLFNWDKVIAPVFDAGTCWWNMVLSTPPGEMNPPRRDFSKDDSRVQRITANVLKRMIEGKP